MASILGLPWLCKSPPLPSPGITICREIHQDSEGIPRDLRDQPSHEETWRQRFVTGAHLEILRPMIETFPTAHIVREDPRYAEIAVTDSCLNFLSSLSIPLRTSIPNDQTALIEGEISDYGIRTARERAERSFILLATEAIWSGQHGHGLDRYYLQHTGDRIMLAKLMWTMLLCRILKSSQTDRRKFLQHCIFVGLHAFSVTRDTSEFLDRDEQTWTTLFTYRHNRKMRRPLGDPEEEVHLVSLLWKLFESVGDRGLSLDRVKSNPSYSAAENLKKLATLMGVRTNTQPLHLGEISQDKANRVLSKCKMFEGAGEVSVATLTEQICRYVPLS